MFKGLCNFRIKYLTIREVAKCNSYSEGDVATAVLESHLNKKPQVQTTPKCGQSKSPKLKKVILQRLGFILGSTIKVRFLFKNQERDYSETGIEMM